MTDTLTALVSVAPIVPMSPALIAAVHRVQDFAQSLGAYIECTATSLTLPDDTTQERWAGIGEMLAAHEAYSGAALKWFIGDWLLHGEERLADVYEQYLGPDVWDYKTVQNCRWVASRISAERRRASLSFAHHTEVAGLPAVAQDRLLSLAEEQGFSRDEFRVHIRAERLPERPVSAPAAPSLRIALTVDAMETAITETMTERQQAELVDRLAGARNGLKLNGLGSDISHRQFDQAIKSAMLDAVPVSELLSAAQRRIPSTAPEPYQRKLRQLGNWTALYEQQHPEEPCAGELTDDDAPSVETTGDFSATGDFSDDVPVPFVLTEMGRDLQQVSAPSKPSEEVLSL